MNQELFDLCPFREKTASRRLYLTLARSDSPQSKGEIAKAAHLTVAKTATLLAAYVNPMHRAPLDRIGVRLVRTKDGNFTLEKCRPKPNAKRPARGQTTTPVKKSKGKSTRQPSAFCIPAKSRSKPRETKPIDQFAAPAVGVESDVNSSSDSAH